MRSLASAPGKDQQMKDYLTPKTDKESLSLRRDCLGKTDMRITNPEGSQEGGNACQVSSKHRSHRGTKQWTLRDRSPRGRHCPENINSHNSSVSCAQLSSLYQQRYRSPERLRNLPKVTQLVRGRAEILTWVLVSGSSLWIPWPGLRSTWKAHESTDCWAAPQSFRFARNQPAWAGTSLQGAPNGSTLTTAAGLSPNKP